MKKNLLAIETSGPLLSVALRKGDEKIVEFTLKGFLRHAENLVPVIDRLLKKKRLTLNRINTFLIGRGPGSFTGLRIGFATLKGFLSLEKKPCYGALSLDMIAEPVNLPEGSQLAVCLDARREKIYTRFYRRRNGIWRPTGAARLLTFPQLADLIPSGAYIAGDAVNRYHAEFEKLLLTARGKEKIYFLPRKFWHPRASSLIRGFGMLQKLDKPRDFLPLYLRRPGPEAQQKRKLHAHSC